MRHQKRILSLLLMIALLCTFIVPASASSEPTLTVTPSVEQINTGTGTADVIYTVKLNPNGNKVAAFQFTLVAPEGMSLASNKLGGAYGNQGGNGYWLATKDLKVTEDEDTGETTGIFTTFEYTPATGYFGASGGIESRTLDAEATIMTIKATVDISAVKTYTLSVNGFICYGVGSVNQGGATPIVGQVTITAAPKPATGITLNKTATTIYTGSDETLIATVQPDDTTDTVTWESSNTAVATVDTNGKVTAVAPGTATITAKAGSQSASCVVTVENAPCIHTTKTNVGEKPSTCKEQGWDAYSKCDDCGQLFDKDGNEISAIPYRTLADHTYGTLIEQVDAVHSSTELKAGTKAHYECSVCHKLFDKGKNEVTAEDLVIKAPAHSYKDTWSKDGTNHWKECNCGAKKDIAAHSFEWVVDKDATEEETGLKHEECVCGETRNLNTVIDKLDHTHNWVETKAKASTCKEQGNNQYFYCTKCEKYYKADKVTETTVAAEMLTLAAHTATPHAAVEATCTKEGNIAYWTCSVCEKYFSNEACTTEITKADTVVSKKSHSYDESKWVSDSSKHWHACSVCGDKKDEAAHTYGSDNKCTECGYAKPTYSGGYLPPAQKPTITSGEGVKVTLSADGTVATIKVDAGYELVDVVLNGTSKGKVTEVKGLKTGDKLVVTAAKKAPEPAEPTAEEIIATLADHKLAARSKVVTMKNGKKAVRITWYNRDGEMMEFDGVEIFRSTKRNSGYGKKPIFTSETDKYYNTAVKAGTKYYYKLRGYVVIDGQKYYTDYSLKAIRTVK